MMAVLLAVLRINASLDPRGEKSVDLKQETNHCNDSSRLVLEDTTGVECVPI